MVALIGLGIVEDVTLRIFQKVNIEIAKLLNMDSRRVCDIVAGKRDQNGRILRR